MALACMALWSSSSGRAVLVLFCAIMALSTGVASSTLVEEKAVTGHATFVEAVESQPAGIQGPKKPIHYGLATLRVDYVFGLLSRERPLDETTNQMVFVWSEDTPDPRDDPSLQATGDLAQVTDRNGVRWIVYEFGYQGPRQDPRPPASEPAFYTYAVALGPERSLGDGSSYNHVLTYRPDRLIAPLMEAQDHEPVPVAAPGPQADPDTWVGQGVLDDGPSVQEFALVKGVAPVPPGLFKEAGL